MKKHRNIIQSAVGIALSFFVLMPFLVIVINSFKTKKEAADAGISFPRQMNAIENYRTVFETGVSRSFRNSCIVTILSVLLIIILSSSAAYVLQRRHSGICRRLSTYFVIGLIVPGQIIPTYIICSYLHLKEFLGAALVLAAANIPLGVFLYLGSLKGIPRDIDEAAIMDGCSSLSLFRRILFPLLKPMTTTLFVLTFMNIWNDFGTTIYFLNTAENYTLPLTIYNFFSTHSSDWNLVFADVVIVSLPVMIIYFCAQRQIMSGMVSGAVKG